MRVLNMPVSGDNLPAFRSVQLDFAAHIRNPEINPRPVDVEARRMQVYVDLFYNNIKSFLDSAFPVSRQILGEPDWRGLVREFVHRHPSESPYFLQISEEFLTFLHDRGLTGLPSFLLELCHYEWVELALDVAPDEPGAPGAAAESMVKVSQSVRALVYEYPVHIIGADFQPDRPPEQPTFLIVYRTPDMQVRFMESNSVTHRLLALLDTLIPLEAIEQIRLELSQAGREVAPQTIRREGEEILTRLKDAGIISGTSDSVL